MFTTRQAIAITNDFLNKGDICYYANTLTELKAKAKVNGVDIDINAQLEKIAKSAKSYLELRAGVMGLLFCLDSRICNRTDDPFYNEINE